MNTERVELNFPIWSMNCAREIMRGGAVREILDTAGGDAPLIIGVVDGIEWCAKNYGLDFLECAETYKTIISIFGPQKHGAAAIVLLCAVCEILKGSFNMERAHLCVQAIMWTGYNPYSDPIDRLKPLLNLVRRTDP